ncbi:Zn-dependent membrane protease YugP [Bacillus thermophilus]|uniref:Zn-dependent membrane protease YugP n=1 Tax=Siminovitchia thermophila TaxID=1245522 RepID=A0ABS2R077_9BACI|nr:DUF3784 domain-containing protein [Siminovitchia thermophila]MBM7713046.1 Zn-dependent membrane protease YugP [Siminovitchia thermophila]ONK25113.1 hypothetical protein BLX87_01300 [Bacillus sp. VT-16-64]
MFEATILIIIFISFFIFAIVLSRGKGAFLIAGYNTMSDSEKAQYDEVALCKFMGKIMFGVCLSILLLTLSEVLGKQVLLIIGLILLFTLIIFALVYLNTGNRFKKKA